MKSHLCLPLALLPMFLLAGCAGGPPEDAAERAKLIAELMKEGDAYVSEVRQTVQDAQRESRGIDSKTALKKMGQARTKFREAMELSPESYSPRSRFAHSLMLTGILHHWDWDSKSDEYLEYRRQNKVPPKAFTAAREASHAEAEKYLRQALQELDYYKTYLMAKYPLEDIHLQRSNIYVHLGEYGNAAQALRDHIAFWGTPRITPEAHEVFMRDIRKFEELEIDRREREELENPGDRS